MAQTVLQQVLILAAMMMLGFLLGKLGKVDRKGADLLSMLLLDVFFPCNILAAASGDFGDMPFSQVIKIALAYMSCFILFTLLAKPIAKLLRLNEDDSLVFTRSVAYPNNGFGGIPLCTAVFGTEGTVLGSLSVPCATLYMFLFIMQSFRREKDHNLKQQLKSMLTPMNISAVLMIIMLATGWKFTGAPLQFLSSLANCVLPTSMIIIGCLLSGSPLIDVLKKPILYFITLLRGFILLTLCFYGLPLLLGKPGIWLATPLAELLTTLFILIIYMGRKRNGKENSISLQHGNHAKEILQEV